MEHPKMLRLYLVHNVTDPSARIHCAGASRMENRNLTIIACCGLTLFMSFTLAYGADLFPVAPAAKGEPPSWAYPLNAPGVAVQPAQNDTAPHRVPGSNVAL